MGDFLKKGLGTMILGKTNFKLLIGLCPIYLDCICVSSLWHFDHVFRNIFICLCIAHMCSVVLHTTCLIKCSNGIFLLVWTPMSSNCWDYP